MSLDGYAYINGPTVPKRKVLFLPLRHWTETFWEKKKKEVAYGYMTINTA